MALRIKCEFFLGKKWYPFLIKKDNRPDYLCLLADVGYVYGKIYVRMTTSGRYIFSCFNNPIELKIYIDKFQPSVRCFDEIIVDGHQKPRFDIDIERSGESDLELDVKCQDLINQVISAILYHIPNITPEKNIRLFTSHGENKRSVHIIVDGVFHENYRESVGFFDSILDHISEEYRKYLDRGIYGKMKQLRILGCCKWQSDRVKILKSEYLYKSDKILSIWPDLDNDVTRFMSSLITVTSGGIMISGYAKPVKVYNDHKIENEQIGIAINLAKEKLGKEFKYALENVKGSVFVLRRIAPSHCVICKRIHEKQHPFLFLSSSGELFFNCRRSETSYYLGNVGNITVSDIKVPKKEPIRVLGEKDKIIVKDSAIFNFGSVKSVISEETMNNIPANTEELKMEDEEKPNHYSSSDVISRKFSLMSNEDKPKRRKKVKEDVPLSSLIDFNNIPW